MVGYKACPLCEKADKVEMFPKSLFLKNVADHGTSMLIIKCTRCDIEVDDYNMDNTDYETVHDRLATKWNSLPRWQKVCIR
jgi:hypothetical protein